MNAVLHRFSTPLTVGFFAVSAISGTALFFHLGEGIFHEMHEWLSMVLLAPIALHLWKNWGPLVAYARRGTLLLPVAAALLLAGAFAVPGRDDDGPGGHDGRPGGRAVQLMIEAPLSDLAPVLKTTPDALAASLRQRGYTVNSPADSLHAVASTAGVPAAEILFGLIAGR